jgi:hypothetical protein
MTDDADPTSRQTHEQSREELLASIARSALDAGFTTDEVVEAMTRQLSVDASVLDDESLVAIAEEPDRPARAEHDEDGNDVKYWTDLISRSGYRVLKAKLDDRWHNPDSIRHRSQIAEFENIGLDQSGEYHRHANDPGGNLLITTLGDIEKMMRGRGKNTNVLLFFTNHEINEKGHVGFAYRTRMAKEHTLDPRTDDEGSPMNMYGNIPASSLPELWRAIQERPELIDEVFKSTFSKLFEEGWIKRRQSDSLAVGYVTAGPMHQGAHDHDPEEVMSSGFERKFTEPVGEVPAR